MSDAELAQKEAEYDADYEDEDDEEDEDQLDADYEEKLRKKKRRNKENQKRKPKKQNLEDWCLDLKFQTPSTEGQILYLIFVIEQPSSENLHSFFGRVSHINLI